MAVPTAGTTLETALPIVQFQGLNTLKASNLAGMLVDTSGNTTVPGTLAVTGVATFTAAPVFNGGRVLSVLASSGNTTITAATSGSTRLFDSAAGITYTLPAPAVGLTYRFVWTVSQSSSNHVIVTDAGTTFIGGGCSMFSGTDVTPSSTLGPKFFAANGTSHIKFTSNATTTGTAVGSWLEFVCYDSTHWTAYGVIDSPSGTIATPWST
jgi:hypothetical protein